MNYHFREAIKLYEDDEEVLEEYNERDITLLEIYINEIEEILDKIKKIL